MCWTPLSVAAAMAARCWASRLPGTSMASVLMRARRSTPAKALRKISGRSKSAARISGDEQAIMEMFHLLGFLSGCMLAGQSQDARTVLRRDWSRVETSANVRKKAAFCARSPARNQSFTSPLYV